MAAFNKTPCCWPLDMEGIGDWDSAIPERLTRQILQRAMLEGMLSIMDRVCDGQGEKLMDKYVLASVQMRFNT